MIDDVVSEVDEWRAVDRGQPDGVDAEGVRLTGQMTETVNNAGQVSVAVIVPVGKAQRIDLINRGVPPPLHASHPPIESRRASAGTLPATAVVPVVCRLRQR